MKHMNTTFWSIPSSSLKPGKKFSEDIECFATENKTYLLGQLGESFQVGCSAK